MLSLRLFLFTPSLLFVALTVLGATPADTQALPISRHHVSDMDATDSELIGSAVNAARVGARSSGGEQVEAGQASCNLLHTQAMVLEVKRIFIPEHPYAFNASLVRWKGRLLLSFREIQDLEMEDELEELTQGYALGSSLSASQIGLIELDEHFDPIGQAQILQHAKGMQDPRLIVVGDELLVVYSEGFVGHRQVSSVDRSCRMHIAKLIQEGEAFTLQELSRLEFFDGVDPLRAEKNWVPFEYGGQLHLAYSLCPHTIFLPLLEEGSCWTLAQTQAQIHWPWGELRGGTPALAIDSDHFLGFFHSCIAMVTPDSDGQELPCYFMGAYLFDRKNPFAITHISQEPIVAREFYEGEIYAPYWHPVRVVFPCGLIVQGEDIWVSYGRQDHEIWLVKLDKQALLESLVALVPRH